MVMRSQIILDEHISLMTYISNMMAKKRNNICCVGDDDQSIYSWRGAEIRNFLDFSKTYKNTIIIKLEQNYRSTKNILNAASGLISKNNDRLGKKLLIGW